MEPISIAIGAATAATTIKAGLDILDNLENTSPGTAASLAAINLLSSSSASGTATSATLEYSKRALEVAATAENLENDNMAPFLALMNSTTASPGASGQNGDAGPRILTTTQEDGTQCNEVVLNFTPEKLEVTVDSNNQVTGTTIGGTVESVDEKYMGFGHLQDFCKELASGHIPSAHAAYLALLDIVDAIDMNIMGDKITRERIQDNIKHHTYKENASVQQINIDKDEITKEAETDTEKREHTVGGMVDTTKIQHDVYVDGKLTDGTKIIVEKDITTDAVTVSDRQSLFDRIFGGAVESKTTANAVSNITCTVESYDRNSKQYVLVEKTSGREEGPTIKRTDREWENGYVSYVPFIGSGVDLTRKHLAGFSLTTVDYVNLAVDVVAAAVTFGAFSAASSAAKVGVTNVVGKGVAKEVTKASGKGIARTATRGATSAAHKVGTKAALSPVKAAARLTDRYAHPGQVFSPKRIASKAMTSAHNPMRGDYLKTMERLHKMKLSDKEIKNFLQTEFEGQGAIGKLRADKLTTQYRFAKQQGLFSPQNLERLRMGKNPINKLGQRMDIDHVIPKSLAPELKADPGNLAFLNQRANIVKSNNMLRHVEKLINEYSQALPEWKPSPELQAAINQFRASAANGRLSTSLVSSP